MAAGPSGTDPSYMRGELYAIDRPKSAGLPPHGRIGVALAEEHSMLRRTLRRLIDGERDMRVIVEATEPEGLVGQLRRSHPDVLVLDARRSEGSSVDQIRRLHSLVPGTQIVLITMQDSRALADAALAAGAIGFVLKDTADQELCEAVRHAADNVPYLSPRVIHP